MTDHAVGDPLPHPVDLAVFDLSQAQCGVFSRRQAMTAGADDSLIRRRLSSGRWTAAAPAAVYGLPGHPPSFHRSLWIAVLAAGPEAVVSHWSAAAVHGLTGFPPTRLTVTVPHGRYPAAPPAAVYQTVAPPAPVVRAGLPVTPLPRTFVDLGRMVGPRRLGTALDDAVSNRQCSLAAVRRTFLELARPGRPGITTLRTVLDERSPGWVPPRSELERVLDAILDSIGIPYSKEAPLPGREQFSERVDRRYEAPRKLIVEGDGRRWHTRVDDFVRDRQRDRIALRHGYPTARYAYEELTQDAAGVRYELLGLLGLL